MRPKPLHAWEDVIDDEIRRIHANYEVRRGLGQHPALLCVDNRNAVFGEGPGPVLEAIERFPSSCGMAAWDAMEPTRHLMSAARESGIPVIHTTVESAGRPAPTKRKETGEDRGWSNAFFRELRPEEGELVIPKPRASAFYGPSLTSHLVQMGVDTLILCGNSTSGCVRATVVDAYSAGYRVAVVEECVFDRNWLSHKVNLFDMHSKYADVMFLEDVLDYLAAPSPPSLSRRTEGNSHDASTR